MAEYQKERMAVENPSVDRGGSDMPTILPRYNGVVYEEKPMSAGAIIALVLGGIAAAIAITMLILNSQQANRDQQLADEKARADSAEQAAQAAQAQAAQASGQAQAAQQQPPVIVVPQPQSPAAAAPPQAGESATAPSAPELEAAITSKFLDDRDLRLYAVNVKVSDRVATLSGHVPTEALKIKAEKLTLTVSGIRGVINTIAVQTD